MNNFLHIVYLSVLFYDDVSVTASNLHNQQVQTILQNKGIDPNFTISIMRDMENGIDPNRIRGPGLNTMIGLMVVGWFAWLDDHESPDYSIIMNNNNPNREHFAWISWEEFRSLRIIRNAFAHTLEGIVTNVNQLRDLQQFQTNLQNGTIQYEKVMWRETDQNNHIITIDPYFTLNGSRVIPDLHIITRTARIVVQYAIKNI